MQAIPTDGVRPEETAISYVKGPVSVFIFFKITQEGGRGVMKLVFIVQRAQFLSFKKIYIY